MIYGLFISPTYDKNTRNIISFSCFEMYPLNGRFFLPLSSQFLFFTSVIIYRYSTGQKLKKESGIQNSWLRVQVTFPSQLFPSSLRYALYPKAFFFSRIDTFAGQNSVLIYDAQATKIIWDLL